MGRMSIYLPDTFMYGAATSSFQIEGHNDTDGAASCIWSSFSKKDFNGQAIAPVQFACNHYKMRDHDVTLMKKLGLQSYRFSVSWPRILPAGKGCANEKGLDFYDKLVDRLLESRIVPMLTLYHWDLPAQLQQKGGWSHPDITDWFSNYTAVLAGRLADRVPLWITFNEPWVFLHKGMVTGEHAPGLRDTACAAKSYRNILLCHGLATDILHNANSSVRTGAACNLSPFTPATDSEEDLHACRKMDEYQNLLFLDPWMKGEIPDIIEEAFDGHFADFSADELKTVHKSMDFIGINYYTRHIIRHDSSEFLNAGTCKPDSNKTEMDWEIYPEGLYQVLKWAWENYNTAMYVTENGSAFVDQRHGDRIRDTRRLHYLRDHIQQCVEAVQNGLPLKGYYAWSLMDNYEWTFGYDKRFGLIYIDFDTKERIIKDSGLFYRDVIARHRNREPLQFPLGNRHVVEPESH